MSTGSRLAVVAVVLVLSPALAALPVAAQPIGPPGFTGASGTVVIAEGETADQVTGVAGTILIRGTVTGDVSAAAGNVVIAESGHVRGSVNVATGSLRIDGTVDGSVSAGAGTVVLGPSGTVRGDFDVGAGSVVLAGTIRGDAAVGGETIELLPTALIEGNLRYDGSLAQREGSTVRGSLVQDEDLGQFVSPFSWVPPALRFPAWIDSVYGLFANLVLGGLLLLVFPTFSTRVADSVTEEPVRAGGVGLLALVGTPILLVFVAITVIGIPIALFGLLVYVLAIWIGAVYGEFAVGRRLLAAASDEENRWLALLVGLLAFAVVGFIPIVGGLAVFFALLVGLGATSMGIVRAYRSRRDRRRSSRAGTETARGGGSESGDEPGGAKDT
ncbi:MAG: polymer-forming cytoskeletal protein [Halodesulfurarchaeum sp.]